MSHWFHRNTLKPTKWAKYELKAVLTNDATSKICRSVGSKSPIKPRRINLTRFSELRLRRDKFLEHLLSASTDLETVESEFNAYLGLLYGFLFEIGTERKDVNSKLRYLERFTWGGSVQDGEALYVSRFLRTTIECMVSASTTTAGSKRSASAPTLRYGT